MCALCQLPTVHEAERIIIANYIDPGSGYVVSSIIPFLLGVIGALLAGAGMIFRRIWFNKKVLIGLILLIIIIGGIIFLAMMSQSISQTNTSQKVVVLAVDGLDPKFVEKGIEDGSLPNFKKLKDQGYYSPLETSVPPQSPVAWASFITGTTPAKHKVYDFIGRNPNNYTLHLNFSDSPPHTWLVKPFWEYTTENKINSTVLFLPDTYPVPKKFEGKLIAGMGVPDLLGTQGSLTLFSTQDHSLNSAFRGKAIKVEDQDKVQTDIEGPKYKNFNKVETSKIPLEITKNDQESVELMVENKKITLKKGEFSDWISMQFAVDFINKIPGIGKFYLKEVSPLELYLSPINFDPEKPYRDITTPKNFAKELAKENGRFYTQGLPIDSWALDQEIFDEKTFLKHAQSILEERKKIYFSELNKYKSGLFIAYFGNVDSVQHMFWRFLTDEKSEYKNVIADNYKQIDEILGETLKKIDKDTTLVLLSDHGFDSFDYDVNLNSWLRDEGYLSLKEGTTSKELYENVDWSKTKAYAAGYNGIFLNVEGREKEGIVKREEYKKIRDEIRSKLLEYNNPLSNSPMVKKVYTQEELGIPSTDTASPDMFVGFYKGSRSSWNGAAGVVEEEAVKNRVSKWSGDHLFDPSEVPGVLLVNRKLSVNNPKIIDIMPSILGLYGVVVGPDTQGTSIFGK